MRVKKFDNKWFMGLLICTIMLVSFYLLKIIFPEFVIEIAEIDSIVRFGNFIDSNIYVNYAYNYIVSFIVCYLYYCACCRKSKLRLVDVIIILVQSVLLDLVQIYLPELFFVVNIATLIITPIVIQLIHNEFESKNILSLIICFTIHNVAQIISLNIRNISDMIICENTATYTILLLDVYIWEFLLYNYFNFRKGGE